ncbi:MAG: nucleotidyltransferase domain-containing protein [Bacillota bacterium]
MVKKSGRAKVVSRKVVVQKLNEVIDELKNEIPVDIIYLYGSYASGRPGPHSDVDVMVVSPAFGKDLIQETVFLMELFEKTGLMVEPRAYSRDEFLQARPGTFLYEEVIQKGHRLL